VGGSSRNGRAALAGQWQWVGGGSRKVSSSAIAASPGARQWSGMLAGRMTQVVDYDPAWPMQFARLRDGLWVYLKELALGIEHVGSTSVPGLAAKPILDVDVVIASRNDLRAVVARLATAGYSHRGDLGIEDREAFAEPAGWPRHHLYVCSRNGLALRNHLTLRDHLRAHPEDAVAYAVVKRELAAECGDDVEEYARRKSDFILAILKSHGFSADDLEAVHRPNRT
jgi:GrpB-like predicted nucleotidyltransferase (UPF0157 family)